MVDSKKLLDTLETILRERGADLEEWLVEWDCETGVELGYTKKILSPENGLVLNRNVRLIADRLGMTGNERYEKIVSPKAG